MNTVLTAIAFASFTAFPLANAGPESSCTSSSSAYASMSASYAEKADIIDTALAAGSFKTLAAALTKADLIEILKGKGPFTVFAPTDEAFAKLPKGTVESLLKPENKDKLIDILTYHVIADDLNSGEVLDNTSLNMLNGQRVKVDAKEGRIGSAKIIQTDIDCTNGVIHVIDEVILPASQTILETAQSAGSFTILSAAIEAAGLVDALSGDADLTVFAPTDDAFAKLPAGTVETLLKPENLETLRSILLYHVVEGRVYSDDAIKAKSAMTLQGTKLKIMHAKNGVMINNAKVTGADVDATNGVIHVIDTVILPSED